MRAAAQSRANYAASEASDAAGPLHAYVWRLHSSFVSWRTRTAKRRFEFLVKFLAIAGVDRINTERMLRMNSSNSWARMLNAVIAVRSPPGTP